jgi:hypothetical protein
MKHTYSTFILRITIILFTTTINSCTNQSVKLKHTLKEVAKREWRVCSLKSHGNYELKPNLDYTDTCVFFVIKNNGKYYYYETDDCCNSQHGTILLSQSKIIIQSKVSTLVGRFPNFTNKNMIENDSSFEDAKLNNLSDKWERFFSPPETLGIKLLKNELKIWNNKNDTALLLSIENKLKSNH